MENIRTGLTHRERITRAFRHELRNLLFWAAALRLVVRRSRFARISRRSWTLEDVPIMVINLPRRTDRLKQIRGEFSRIAVSEFEVVPGIDGREVFSENPVLAGKRGCAASHIEALSRARLLDRPVLVIEDDLVFTQPFEELKRTVDAFLIDSSLDLLLLDWSTVRAKSISSQLQLVTDSVLCSAYLAKPKAIGPIVRSFERSAKELEKGRDLPIDHAWWRPQRWELVTVAPRIRLCEQSAGQSDTRVAHV